MRLRPRRRPWAWLRDLSIRGKLLLLVLTSTAVALVLAGAGFVAICARDFERGGLRNLDMIADMNAANLRAPITFEDQKAALELIAAVGADPTILRATVFDAKGGVFARWTRDPGNFGPPIAPLDALREGHGAHADQLWSQRRISLNGDQVGTISIVADTSALERRIEAIVGLTVVLLLGALTLSLVFALFSQQLISAPILELARVSSDVRRGDYGVRAGQRGRDEIGHLIDAFNGMLDQIETHKVTLEDAVVKRTAELRASMEEAKAANRAKSDFLATMSHEIRTPLNGVLGMNAMLLEADLTPDQKMMAQTMRSSADALLALLNDVLDFSKMEAGKLHLEEVEFDLVEVVEEAVELMSGAGSKKNLEMASLFAPEVPLRVSGDPLRVRQVLANLLGNGVKFTESGSVVIQVSVAPEAAPLKDHDLLRFDIVDTGVGISAANIERIFQEFTQADSSHARRYGGTGLGLAICQQLAELMGGTISVAKSELGCGSTFRFTARLPRVESVSSTDCTPRISGKVMVLSDSAILRSAALNALTTAPKIEPLLVSSCAELDLAEKPDALLIDARMCTKCQRCRWTKNENELSTERVPIVLISRHTKVDSKACFSDGPLTGVIPSPIRRSALLATLSTCLGPDRLATIDVAPRAEVSARLEPLDANILLVEDHPVNRRVAEHFLKNMVRELHVAVDGRDAIEQHTQQKFDLILMDCQMPDVDGFEATRRIRALEQGSAQRVPIIAITANSMSGDRQLCLDAGMDDYLAKPFRRTDLERHLHKWLGEPRP